LDWILLPYYHLNTIDARREVSLAVVYEHRKKSAHCEGVWSSS